METTALVSVSSAYITRNRITELIDRFILSADIRMTSKQSYRGALKQFFLWLSDNKIDLMTVRREEILLYKSDCLNRGLSPLTISLYLTSIRQFFQFMENNGGYSNPAKSVKLPKRVQQFQKSALSAEQCSELLKVYEGKPRELAIVTLMLRTGIRCIEVKRINLEDVKYKNGQRVLMIQGKGHDSKDQFVVLTDKTWKVLSDYIASRGRFLTSEPLFTSDSNNSQGRRLSSLYVSQIAKEALNQIGLTDRSFSAHSLRHSCACSILRAGGSIYDCQTVLRHSSPVTTQVYIKSISEEMRLRNPAENLIDAQF